MIPKEVELSKISLSVLSYRQLQPEYPRKTGNRIFSNRSPNAGEVNEPNADSNPIVAKVCNEPRVTDLGMSLLEYNNDLWLEK